jgi:hypothetical protein
MLQKQWYASLPSVHARLIVPSGCCLVLGSLAQKLQSPWHGPVLAPQLRAEARRGVLLDALIELQHLVFG